MKKRNLALIISGSVIFVIGIVLLIIAYAMQGTDILAWFGTKWGITVEICVGVYILLILFLIVKDWIQKL